MSVPVKIYDKNLEIVADLEKAYDVTYQKALNEVWTGSFSFPADNDKNDLIQGHYYAELYDGGKRIGLFRIDEPIENRDDGGAYVVYQCSHVLDTLNDKYIGKTSKVTKSGAETAVQYIVDQHSDWQLGDFEFSKSFDYEFNRQTLLDALLSVPQPWWEDWELTFNTRSHPWTLNVEEPNTDPKGTLRYSKNIVSLERDTNYKEIVTRLYAYGEGSGDDQVDISSANPTGNKYIDSDNTSEYGVIVDIWEEQYFDSSSDLYQAAKKYLAQHDSPRVTYRGDAADIYQLTDLNRFELGEYITVYDPDLGIDNTVRVTEIRKGDMTGDPGRMSLELSNKSRRFPSYGALAFKDKATEDNLASGSVGGGALASGGTGTSALANEAVTWDKIEFKTESGDYYRMNSLEIDAAVSFVNNFTEIDKLEDGDTYAKMQKDWRSASDVTKIAGGEIYTDSVDLTKLNLAPTGSENIVTTIEAHADGERFDGGYITVDSATVFESDYDPSEKYDLTDDNLDDINEGFNYKKLPDEWKYTDTTIAGGFIETGTIALGALAFTPLESDSDEDAIIATINASGETLNIDANKIEITGQTTFASDYDPSTKLGETETAVNSDQIQNETIIEGGKIKTGILETDVIRMGGDDYVIDGGNIKRADITGQNTSNDTDNVNGTSASTVESNASEGSDAWFQLDDGAWDISSKLPTTFQDQGSLSTQNEANWSSDILGTGKPDDYADVTNDNTANDTDNVNGTLSSTIDSFATDGHNSWDSLSVSQNYDTDNDLITYDDGFGIDGLEPKESNADETQAHEGEVNAKNLINGVKQANADETETQVEEASTWYVEDADYGSKYVVTDVETDQYGNVTNVVKENITFVDDYMRTIDTFLSPNYS